MAQDFYIDPATNDWSLESGTTIRLCLTQQELIRQRLSITLKMFQGEWFADTNFGIPYFQSIYGKDTKDLTDATFKTVIRKTEGVQTITNFQSSLDNVSRKYTASFEVETDTGDIIEVVV